MKQFKPKNMKYLAALFFVTVALISCNNQSKKGMITTDHEKLVKKYFEHFNDHEWMEMANMYSAISEFKDPTLGKGIVKQTRQQIIEKYTGLSEIFPDVKDQVIQTYQAGDHHIIVEFISSGTAANNTKFELPICTIFTIEKGLITKDFTYFDNFQE